VGWQRKKAGAWFWLLRGIGFYLATDECGLVDGWMVRGDFCVAEFTWRRGEWPCAELGKAVWASQCVG
jgi:hypothetical protein